MTTQEIRAEIREIKAAMKAAGIRRVSCFNGGLSGDAYRYNARLYALECALAKAKQSAA